MYLERGHYGLEVLELDVRSVDWERLIDDAARRRGIFGGSDDREKGFRDRIIAETFLQGLAGGSQRGVERSAFVTGDPGLHEFVSAQCAESDAVAVLRDAAALTTYLGALNSQLEEQFVARLKPQAAELFLGSATGDGLFLAAGIPERIATKFAKKLGQVPEGGIKRESQGWLIEPPTFIGLDGSGVTQWESRVIALSEVARTRNNLVFQYNFRDAFNFNTNRYLSSLSPEATLVDRTGMPISTTGFINSAEPLGSTTFERVETTRVEEVFAVRWTAELSGEALANPAVIGEIEYVDTRGLGGEVDSNYRNVLKNLQAWSRPKA